jgi:hypothetical protein
MNRAAVFATGQLQLFKIETVIFIGAEDFCAVVATKYDMLWLVDDHISG